MISATLCPVTCLFHLFIDDFHLLTDGRIAVFLCMLANRRRITSI